MTNNELMIMQSIQNLDAFAYNFTDDIVVSGDYKCEFYVKLLDLIESYKSKGYKGFNYKETTCKYCYPGNQMFEFYDSDSGEFVDRYIIHEEKEGYIFFSKCCNEKNNSWKELLNSL